MRRDPTEFRQRFAAWKDGENYWDTRGEDMLPGYSGGKAGFYNTHRNKWKLFLISKGVGAEQADRLSVYFAALDSLESGGGTSSAARQKNNFGGMQRGGKNISYDTVQDYMNDKWNMMNKRFSRALNAKTVQEYATLINDPKYAGKGYLYAVADGYNQKNPLDRAWVARQIQHMNNYTKAMMGIAGLKGFVARPVPKAPVISKAEPILKANPIPSAVELLKQNELPVVLPEPTITTTQTPTQAAQQAQLSEYIQKPLVSEKVPVLGGDYWENFFNNNSLDQFQSLIQQLMTSHKHGKNILPRHADGKTPGEYNEELVELPEVRVDDEGNVVQDGRRGSIRLPNLEVIANPIDVGRGEAARILKNAFIESNDATATPYSTNSHLNYKGIKGMTQAAAWMKDNPTLNNAGMALGAAPFAVAGYPAFIAAGEGAATALTNPYVDAALTSGFGAHGLNHAINEGIDGWGDAAMTALEIAPLGRVVKPVYESTFNIINSTYNKLPWTYKIPENPNMAYRRMGPLERDWIMEGNELGTRAINPATELEREAAIAAEKAKNPNRRFVLFKAGAEHGGRKQFAKGQPWRGTTVTHGEEQVLAIPGEGLPWVSGRHFQGPQGTGFGVGDISFEEAPFGTHIDLLTEEGYTGVNPSLLDGSVIYSPYKILGRNFGYRKLYPQATPQITAENAASMTPEQWTAAQDAAIARGDMAEAQRLRDLHFKVKAPKANIPDQYHGTHYDNLGNQIILNKGLEQGTNGVGFYTSSNKPYARKYGPNIFRFKVNARKENLAPGRFAYLSETRMNDLKTQGYEGTIDTTSGPMLGAGKDATEYTFFNPNSYRLADAVTFDNNGVRIPLGKRDNFKINDIRYGIVPFLGIGSAAYGLNKFKHGKSPIHINPANRGKFNALKKRTGKTTELLTHSKNPLTRKRAIFAQNAAKWRRK